jgi:hypothetical protein
MAALFVSIPFVVKTSWPHYLAYLPVCQAVLLLAAQPDDVNGPGWRRARLSFTWLSLLVSSTILLNWLPGWEVYNSSGMLFVANFLVFLAVSATAVPLARSGALVALEQSLPKVGKS